MARKRNYYRYYLKKGNEILYVGITKEPNQREEQHRIEGKRFSHLKKIGPTVSKETAEEWEAETLKKHRWNHGGDNPKYNKTNK